MRVFAFGFKSYVSLTRVVLSVALVENPLAYFAERLYKSMVGMGTDDELLCRVVVTRCEVDMVEIKVFNCVGLLIGV
jgi:hypothetical protein